VKKSVGCLLEAAFSSYPRDGIPEFSESCHKIGANGPVVYDMLKQRWQKNFFVNKSHFQQSRAGPTLPKRHPDLPGAAL
jgi:hypothetical protein